MVAKRIIPCLDIKGGRTVKGIKFLGLRDAGDPVENAARYCEQGADEIVFLDVSATAEERSATLAVVAKVAKCLDIPFTVGGGVRSIADVSDLLNAGADKISVNSAAVLNPGLIEELAREFGSQCVVVAIDTQAMPTGDEVFIRSGQIRAERSTHEWAKEVCSRGAGEILLTSMDHDGVRNGFSLELTRSISDLVPIPVIASGGAGVQEHFFSVFREGGADAALAASVFHDRVLSVSELKIFLGKSGVEVRGV